MSELVTQNIPNLIGGVSEATPSLRLSSQCEAQENCMNDVVRGMSKRPATRINYQFGLGNPANGVTNPETYFWFDIDRDATEKYKLAVSADDVRVFDARNGYEYNVAYGSEALGLVSQASHEERIRNYLRRQGQYTPHRAYKAYQSYDSTFILNKTVPVRPVRTQVDLEPDVTSQTRYTLTFTKHPKNRRVTVQSVGFNRPDNAAGGNSTRRTIANYNSYRLTVAGVDHYFTEVEKPLKDVVQWAYTKISDQYNGTAAQIQQNGDYIDVVMPAGATASISGRCVTNLGTENGSEKVTDFVTVNTYRDIVANFTPAVAGALWYIKQADYATKYTIKIDGYEVSVETPEATTAQARAGLATVNLTADMAIEINNSQGTHGCSAQQYGNVLFISKLNGSDFTIEASDDLGGKASLVIKDVVEAFEDLPPVAPEGYQVEVSGEPEAEVDSYHVKFTKTSEDGVKTAGVWAETIKFGINTLIDPYTMPIQLKRVQNGTVSALNPAGISFELDIFQWGERTVGDENTAPYPSFVSEIDNRGRITLPRTIKDMSVHKNRMVFVSEENVVLSEANEFLNFFPTTVITVLDGDPIDLSLDLNSVNPIEHILDASGTLFLFSPERQMKLDYDGVLSLKTADVKVLTSYVMDTTVPPVAVGDSIYFWSKRKSDNHFMEMYQYNEGDLWTARPVTEHVPQYVKGQPLRTVVAPANNIMITLCESEDEGRQLYVYNYFKQGRELQQSAWQRWWFNSYLVDISMDQGVLSMIAERPDGFNGQDPALLTYLENISFVGVDALEEEHGHKVLLDSVEEVASDFVPSIEDDRVVKTYGGKTYCGFPYEQRYVFSELFARSNDRVLTRGRLQLGHLFLNFTDTTEFTVVLEREARETREILFSGRVIGSLSNLLGVIPIHDGQKSIPIHSKSAITQITILNDTPQDAVFQTADWEGTFTQRARRI